MRHALALLGLALLVAPAALAHGGGDQGYRSRVTSLEPRLAGLAVEVVELDDRLRLENRSGREVVIRGYDGEPYLRFTNSAVHVNARSPARYLNEARFGDVEVPDSADPKAAPRWELVASEAAYEWHDHRVHWMSPIPPPRIKAAPDRPHHIFRWRVPARAGGEPLVIAGTLDYVPPPGQDPSWPLIAGVACVLALLIAGAVALRLRRRGDGRFETP